MRISNDEGVAPQDRCLWTFAAVPKTVRLHKQQRSSSVQDHDMPLGAQRTRQQMPARHTHTETPATLATQHRTRERTRAGMRGHVASEALGLKESLQEHLTQRRRWPTCASSFRWILMRVPRPRASFSVSSLMVKLPSAVLAQMYLG